eukprot:383869_1
MNVVNGSLSHFMVFPWIGQHPPKVHTHIPTEVKSLIQKFASPAAHHEPLTFRIYIAKFKHDSMLWADVRFEAPTRKQKLISLNSHLFEMLDTLKQSYAPNTPPSEGYKLVYDVTYTGPPNYDTNSGFRIIMDDDTHVFVHGVISPQKDPELFLHETIQHISQMSTITQPGVQLSEEDKAQLRASFKKQDKKQDSNSKAYIQPFSNDYHDHEYYYNYNVNAIC